MSSLFENDLLKESSKSISVTALKVVQPIGTFYNCVISARNLFKICYFDIRGLSQQEDFAEFMGIQRQLDKKRVAEIHQYVHTLDPTFPTAIVLAVDERCATIEENVCTDGNASKDNRLVQVTLQNYPEPPEGEDPILFRDIARVIDGQHRIAGLADIGEKDFDLNVSIFVGADIATQASIFSTVNLAQTKVNKSLVYDLFAYAKTRSPEKTCHDIAVVLDSREESPFHQRIKRLGVATEGRFGETLSQATFVRGLLQYISRDVVADRDAAKRGRSYPIPPERYREHLILREFFVKSHDEIIATLMLDYFLAVSKKWPDAWNKTGRGWVLNKSAGYTGLMRFFKHAYTYKKEKDHIPTMKEFLEIFNRTDAPDTIWKSENIRPGSSGEKYVYDLLVEETGII